MASTNVEIKTMPDISCTVNVRIARRLRLRLRLAIWLIRLAALVYPGAMKVEEKAS